MKNILFYMLMVPLVFLSSKVLAANFSNPIDGVFKGIYGDTMTVQVQSLESKSPVTGDQNGDLSFQLNSSTAYTNFSQLTDLKAGDEVRVEYSQSPTGPMQMVATSITRVGSTLAGPTSTTTVVPAAGSPTVVTTTTRVSQ
jgi:hypothetical protein